MRSHASEPGLERAGQLAGLLCESFGWPAVFYFQGALSLVVFTAFGALYRNQPRKHPFISPQELADIDYGMAPRFFSAGL